MRKIGILCKCETGQESILYEKRLGSNKKKVRDSLHISENKGIHSTYENGQESIYIRKHRDPLQWWKIQEYILYKKR